MPRKQPSDDAPPHTLTAESDNSLVEAAKSIFADDLAPDPEPEREWAAVPPADPLVAVPSESTEPHERAPDFGRPGIGDMITVRGGGLYLPVRRRVGWMRGMPEPHPDWTIETIAEEVVRGTFKGGKVEGGYARYRANIFNEQGRLISTGTKTEYSERFTDFAEKAETGSVGRALALAGYGTEAAVDLDEGLDQERIADAPVTPNRPINITPSAIPNVRPGGRPETVQNTQIAEIGRLNKALGLGYGLVTLMEAISGRKMPPLETGKENEIMRAFLQTFTYEEAGEVVQQLSKALREQQAKAAEVEA